MALTLLGYIGIGLTVLGIVLWLTGRKDEARKVRQAAKAVSWTRRGIRLVMAATSFLSGLGLTSYDVISHRGCDDDQSLRSRTAVIRLVGQPAPLAQEPEEDDEDGDTEQEDNEDSGCDDED